MSSRRVVLLRHGRTAWNAERRFQGQLDPPLDDVGRAQAHEVAPLIAALDPDLIVSSDLRRAAETAAVVAEYVGLPVRLDPGLRERDLGHWQGLTRDEVRARYPDEFARWSAGLDVTERGGESREATADRAEAAFEALPAAGTVVLVTHGGTSLALASRLLGFTNGLRTLGSLANCHWSELNRNDSAAVPDGGERWRLRAHNVGAPGTVVPLPRHPAVAEEASDAEA